MSTKHALIAAGYMVAPGEVQPVEKPGMTLRPDLAVIPYEQTRRLAPENAEKERRMLLSPLGAHDFSRVRRKFQSDTDLGEVYTTGLQREYIRFMTMVSESPPGFRTFMPARIDAFWHTHLLFLEDYERFCKEIVTKDWPEGARLIYHEAEPPDFTDPVLRSQYAVFLDAVREKTGDASSPWWPDVDHLTGLCSVSCYYARVTNVF